MREEIIEIVTAAAASIGINAVQENPSDPDSILLPRPRVDFDIGDEQWIKSHKRIAAYATPGDEATTRTTRTDRKSVV